MQEISLFNQKFISGKTEEIVDLVLSLSENMSRVSIVAAINVYLITLCHQDMEVSEFYNKECDVVSVDGRPLVYLSQFFSTYPFPEMVGGPSLWTNLLDHGSKECSLFYFLGSTDELLSRAITNLRNRFDGMNIVGSHNGFFDIDGAEFDRIVDEIKSLKPRFIFVGMPSPQKEYLAARMKELIPNGVIVLIGGAFDYFAGERKIGNELTSRLCLDWLLRMMQEPRRLAARYLRSNLSFSRIVFVNALRLLAAKFKSRFL